jgi:hypothetical protein
MDISNAYKQYQQIKELQDDKAEVLKEIKLTDFAYKLAFVGTFIVYFIFVWMMYVSDLWGFTTWLTENLSEVAALVVYAVLAFTLPLAMALIKEIGYKHFAKYPNPTHTIVLIVGILALAGVIYESISSSSQQQHISTKAAEGSKTFAAVSGSNVVVGQSGISGQIATQSQKVAQCEARLAAGKERHCNGDKAKLSALKESQAAENTSVATANVAAIEAKSKAMANLKEDAYKPVFKSIRDTFGVSISTGVMIVTLFVSVIFEISHLLLILFLGQKLQRLNYLKQAIIQTESGYLALTGKTFNQADFKDDSVLNMADFRVEKPQDYKQTKQGFGFVPQTASMGGSGMFYGSSSAGMAVSNHPAPLFKYQNQAENSQVKNQSFGFIPHREKLESTVDYLTKVARNPQENTSVRRFDESTTDPAETTHRPLAKGSEAVMTETLRNP